MTVFPFSSSSIFCPVTHSTSSIGEYTVIKSGANSSAKRGASNSTTDTFSGIFRPVLTFNKMEGALLMKRLTVATDTPAWWATSRMVIKWDRFVILTEFFVSFQKGEPVTVTGYIIARNPSKVNT